MLDASVRWGKAGRALERRWPGVALRIGDDLEPMQKTFEIAASGAVPLIPPSPDLAPLGFVDGETALVWRDFAELAALVRRYRAEPESFAPIGRATADLSRRRHTWDHRAVELGDIIRRLRSSG
jgi:spore maturation protein CgeB